MNIYEKWQELISNQTEASFPTFWENYSAVEKRIYSDILDHYEQAFSGAFNELVKKYDTTEELFMGFLDGIQSSLIEPLDINKIKIDSQIELKIDLEKLYFNMLEAKADYLYTLPQWNNIFNQDKLNEITKAQRLSKTIVKDKKIGRNDPCPCGSGKKYKKCCGKA